MASGQNQAPNVDLFDAYFRRADLDRDGRISGAEAVAFFQGSGLSKQVLAQIWAFANQSQSGFLGRAEFYNALKLVTVAQSKRELTPDIVKAALYGPAASKIPAPQINFTSTVAPQLNSSAAAPPPASAPPAQIGSVSSVSYQNIGLRGTFPNLIGNQQNFPSLESHLVKPPQQTSTSGSNLAPGIATQGFSVGVAVGGAQAESPSFSSDGISGKIVGTPAVRSSQVGADGINSSSTQDGFGLSASRPNAALPPRKFPVSDTKSSEQVVKDSRSVDASGNGSSDSFFGGDVFSATSSQPNQYSSPQGFSSGSPLLPSAIPVSGMNPNSIKTSTPDSFQSSLATQPVSAQLQQAHPLVKQNQHASIQTRNMLNPSGHPVGLQNSASSQPQSPWPRMTQTDVQKYTKVFVEVDTDKDGKITGEQARNLFLSWRLPREVLKQVWDLSDQDNDSMLSLREFCIALYLMERYREGRVLPAVLPSNIMLDLPSTCQPATHYSAASWGSSSGFQQQQGMTGSGSRPVNPAASRPPRPASIPQSEEGPQNKQQKSRVPVLEKHLISQLSSDEQNSINSKFQDATEADKKVEELEKEILESREKIEFYHNKMQELSSVWVLCFRSPFSSSSSLGLDFNRLQRFSFVVLFFSVHSRLSVWAQRGGEVKGLFIFAFASLCLADRVFPALLPEPLGLTVETVAVDSFVGIGDGGFRRRKVRRKPLFAIFQPVLLWEGCKSNEDGDKRNNIRVHLGPKSKEQGNNSTFRRVLRIFLEDGGKRWVQWVLERQDVAEATKQCIVARQLTTVAWSHVQQGSNTQKTVVETDSLQRDVGVQTEEAEIVILGDNVSNIESSLWLFEMLEISTALS
ncbi:epidermal growth factor receptor substrate 15-like 1 [Senna tora]|uniref:Epidermal growth factor receptor substrate 15-like 1 n=1 Tax=Senna tora TaxID=362788 RepID=A0A834WB43_9FABA|nr:epidermal growth factor receptor substrate 15-like 1 [Senna tora]